MTDLTPSQVLQLIAQGFEVIESDGSTMTLELPEEKRSDWEVADLPHGEYGLVVDTDEMLRKYPPPGGWHGQCR